APAPGRFGTVLHFHRSITPGATSATPGTYGVLSPGCQTEKNPGRDCDVTRIFGNNDSDTFNFDQTFLGGRTRVYGSNKPTTLGSYAPLGDKEDFFFVNQLHTMNVAGAHTLTLDGQAATDTYVINTTGSQPCFGGDASGSSCHNYIINVLDTGAPDDGSDVLIVNGYDSLLSGYSDPNAGVSYATDDIFLLRRSNFIGTTPTSAIANELADDPAFVALLHGNLGLAQTVFTGDITAFNQTITRVSAGSFLAEGFLAGQRIQVSGTGAGVFAGSYTITAASPSTLTLAE